MRLRILISHTFLFVLVVFISTQAFAEYTEGCQNFNFFDPNVSAVNAKLHALFQYFPKSQNYIFVGAHSSGGGPFVINEYAKVKTAMSKLNLSFEGKTVYAMSCDLAADCNLFTDANGVVKVCEGSGAKQIRLALPKSTNMICPRGKIDGVDKFGPKVWANGECLPPAERFVAINSDLSVSLCSEADMAPLSPEITKRGTSNGVFGKRTPLEPKSTFSADYRPKCDSTITTKMATNNAPVVEPVKTAPKRAFIYNPQVQKIAANAGLGFGLGAGITMLSGGSLYDAGMEGTRSAGVGLLLSPLGMAGVPAAQLFYPTPLASGDDHPTWEYPVFYRTGKWPYELGIRNQSEAALFLETGELVGQY